MVIITVLGGHYNRTLLYCPTNVIQHENELAQRQERVQWFDKYMQELRVRPGYSEIENLQGDALLEHRMNYKALSLEPVEKSPDLIIFSRYHENNVQ